MSLSVSTVYAMAEPLEASGGLDTIYLSAATPRIVKKASTTAKYGVSLVALRLQAYTLTVMCRRGIISDSTRT